MNSLEFLGLHEIRHAIVAGGLAWLVWWRWHSRRAALLCFSVGFITDVDHLLDYLIFTGFSRFELLEFLRSPQYGVGKLTVVASHGYDWVIGLALLAWLRPRTRLLAGGVALGLLGHIVVDQLVYSGHPLRYFFAYRLLYGFTHAAFAGAF